MNVSYIVFKRGIYWLVFVTTDATKGIHVLTFMKGKGTPFSLLKSNLRQIDTAEQDYLKRLSEDIVVKTKDEIFDANNYTRTEPEQLVDEVDIPKGLISKILVFLNRVQKNLTEFST